MAQFFYKTITIRLRQTEYEALRRIADQECRFPSRQAAHWVSQCIRRYPLSPSTQKGPADPGRP